MNRFLVGNVIEGMAVTQASSPNMTVTINDGTATISTGTYPTSYGYFCAVDTTGGESVTVPTADTSNPRIDCIVGYIDLSVTPSTGTANNSNNMLKFTDVAGTPSGTPAAPSSAAIQSAIGASNPYIILANIAVAANVTTIVNSNITDLRVMAAPSIPTSTITPQMLLAGTGTSWTPQTWSPSWTNLTVGSGVVTAQYSQVGKVVTWSLGLVWGSGTSVSGSVSFSLPVPSIAVVGIGIPIGQASLYDGTQAWQGTIIHGSTTTGIIRWFNVQSTGIKSTNISSTSPATWSTSSAQFLLSGRYLAA